jgi:alanyl-tRNA synthetase
MDIVKIRQDFIDFFKKNGHKFLIPSKIFIPEDTTLFFTNAGMNQLKDYFLGKKEPKEGYRQLVNSQICIRAGGKKCDIEEIGDSTHLTLFEMLGNWSIGSYGKEVAIELSFKYLIEKCKLNPDQMYVTFFEGTDKLPEDIETKNIWKKYLPENRILKGSFKDNFWQMGDTGPCGACTEIHYDLIGNRVVSELVNSDDQSVVEIWNNVFMEYNRNQEGYEKLNNLHIDTGMGLERLAMVLQGKKNVFETDGFRYLIGYCQALTNSSYYGTNDLVDKAYRIFSDHIRTVVYSLFEGVSFGSSEREFVLRKIYRRMLTYIYLYLNDGEIKEIFFHPLIKIMITDILNYFGKKNHNSDEIWKQLIDEEKLFIGKIRHADLFVKNSLKKNNNKEEIFKHLHESKGIPMEILENIEKIKFVL